MGPRPAAQERFDPARDGVIDLSRRIHAHPELGFEEEKSSGWLCEELADAGFAVRKGICNLPTAFTARFGSDPLNIGICAAYDALPGVGHACGHNIIAASAVGAALAAAEVADAVGLTVTVVGTPAEEVGNASGKILLLERGASKGIHAVMKVHPAPFDMVRAKIIAASMFEVNYTGKESHASAFPELGINAADALTIAQTVWSETLAQLGELRPKVHRCFEAGALATGAGMAIAGGDKPYAEMRHDDDLANFYRRNPEALGRTFPNLGEWETRPTGSTDMGSVSLAMPTIHPMIGINSLPAVNHQPEFTAHCITEDADKALRDGALSMAWTCVDLAWDRGVRQRLIAGGQADSMGRDRVPRWGAAEAA